MGGAPFADGPVGDKGAASLLPLDVAVALEVGQSARHGIGVDPQEARELPNRGELHPGLERPRRDQMPELRHELHVHGHCALPVHSKPRRGRYAARLTRHGEALGSRASRGAGSLGTVSRERPAQPDQRQSKDHPEALRRRARHRRQPCLGRYLPRLVQPVLCCLLRHVVVDHP